MRVSDATLAEVRERGFSLMEGFLGADELAAAQDALWLHFPRPQEYFADPDRVRPLRREPVRRRGGVPVPLLGPEPAGRAPRPRRCRRALPGDARAPSLQGGALGQVRRRRRTTTSRSTATTAATAWWCRDPRPRYQQLTTFVYLSDVTEEDGPDLHRALRGRQGRALHAAVPAVRVAGRRRGGLHGTGGQPPPLPDRHLAPWVRHDGRGPLPLLPARRLSGSGHDVGREDGMAQAASPERWARFIPQCSVRQRDLFGFPRPGDPYWSEETLDGVAARYPGIDLGPYRAS